MTAPAPLLVIGIGNPSRGDDALGSLFIERASEALAPEIASGAVELLTDFQLQIEHALDLEGRVRVVFVDASVRAAPPFELSRIAAGRASSCSTHAMSPEEVLQTYRRIVGEPPESWVLAIRGERFELGEPLSEHARAHLDAALELFVADVRQHGQASAKALLSPPAGRRLEIEGTVQGVGFRPWVHRTARRLGLTGEVWNTPRGVTVEAFGPALAQEALVRALQSDAPPAARIRAVRSSTVAWRDAGAFTIAPSETGGEAAMVLPPDLATCDACLRDMNDPGDRHHAYAFTSCSACGPRFAIARALPYDRATTTMAELTPCAACAREYALPEDRRFHAQTVACPACGPRVWLADARGEELASADPTEAAAALLLEGKILGVQGLGAFHLVCDATNAGAVAELRRRKRRDAQPLAVMVADAAAAEAVAELDDAARAALTSSARPIVLAPARAGALARDVNGPSRRTGVMLPYTPLHHRLASRVARPLVVTSGNPSGGPAVIEHAEARALLGELVDAFLLHDRPIARRVEDSVVAASSAGTRVIRRARGFAPAPVRLPGRAREPVLAVGGHMKNTACLVVGDLAYLTPHLGDLGLVESEEAWQRDIEGLERLLGVRADVIAHDLHPDYASTRFALARPARLRVGLQHHAAHVLAAIAELHIDEPVIGVVYDGSGWGPDGTSWGAEILLVDGGRWRRVNTFRPLPLPGGELAIRDVWRVALAVLCEAFGREEGLALASRLAVFEGQPRGALATVAAMVETRTSTVEARGMGRWFDAIGALALSLPRAGFDGHVAIALEEAAEAGEAPSYPVGLPTAIALEVAIGPAHEVDLRPTVRAVATDLLAGVSPGRIAARFHGTVVEATSAV
ncbi:MAG TPA: carbamoyltransferase HypF, partial [Labilithrix sp.]|nr:carbamoyltransferase HypF [Labilithrix sp.]